MPRPVRGLHPANATPSPTMDGLTDIFQDRYLLWAIVLLGAFFLLALCYFAGAIHYIRKHAPRSRVKSQRNSSHLRRGKRRKTRDRGHEGSRRSVRERKPPEPDRPPTRKQPESEPASRHGDRPDRRDPAK